MTEKHVVTLGNPSKARRRETLLGGRIEIHSARGLQRAQRVLLAALDQPMAGDILVVLSPESVGAMAVRLLFPSANVHSFDMDAYEFHRGCESLRINHIAAVTPHLASDLPRGAFDWVVFAAPHTADARLTGELLRQCFEALRPRGKLLTATDNRSDRWLRERVVDIFGDATIHDRSRGGVVYVARRQRDRQLRRRDFTRRIAAQLFGHAIDYVTRPGVFAHGRLDDGARTLADFAAIETDSRVVELGCGPGALGIAAARVASAGHAILVDSNVRAVEQAAVNAKSCACDNVLPLLAYDLGSLKPRSVDVVLANPPYFGDFRIFEHFCRESAHVLAPGGAYWCVTKATEKAQAICERHFAERTWRGKRGYTVLRCSAPRPQNGFQN